MLRIGRPRDRLERIVVALGPVETERRALSLSLRAQHHVVVVQVRFPALVGGGPSLGRGDGVERSERIARRRRALRQLGILERHPVDYVVLGLGGRLEVLRRALSTASASASGPGPLAGVVGERAPPGRAVRGERDRLFTVGERELLERQRDRRVFTT